MALKGERIILDDNTSCTCNTATQRGVVLCYNPNLIGSGDVLGTYASEADLYANPSGLYPVGMLYGDVVNVDLTRYHLNFQKDETIVGNRVRLITKGRMTTDQVIGTPSAGKTAYLSSSGCITPTLSASGGLVATPKVGVFAGTLDEAGFATVDLTLPIA